MKKRPWKPGAVLAPLPVVLVSCGVYPGNCNIFTAAWTGIVNTRPPMVSLSVRPTRHSYGLIKETGEFIINCPTASLVKVVDWCGNRSGRKYDKFKQCNVTAVAGRELRTPAIDESPVSIECRVRSETALGSHTMFIADVVAVEAADGFHNEDGAFQFDAIDMICYANGFYYSVGTKIHRFGYSVRKKKKN